MTLRTWRRKWKTDGKFVKEAERRSEAGEDETLTSGRGTPSPAQERSLRAANSAMAPSPRVSGVSPVSKERNRSSRKRFRHANSPQEREREEGEGEGEEEVEDAQEPQMRNTIADSCCSATSAITRGRPSGNMTYENEEFFHDLSAMQPLRIRLGVCPLPGDATTAEMSSPSLSLLTEGETSTTALLLEPRKFFTLPEEKGGKDIVGWAAAFPSVAVDLPGEGVYNNTSVSVTVMLAP
ncbi:hypothetical protein MOQ_008946 [Trypanosoma cruzi marinkellei]|uniref:Uncharacterized protein n=1 Tax=Trypanosoma cruzi marinkellei TaxID=85056 RepID=K2LXE4_TRYCR|nr:hypothetical protein MOQ_008946 [Trypanosoma cruzi marinkellei]